MTMFIELPSGTIVDIDELIDLYQDRKGKWHSSVKDSDDIWDWDKGGDVEIVRKALLARKKNTLQGSFVCDHCGAPNIVEDE